MLVNCGGGRSAVAKIVSLVLVCCRGQRPALAVPLRPVGCMRCLRHVRYVRCLWCVRCVRAVRRTHRRVGAALGNLSRVVTAAVVDIRRGKWVEVQRDFAIMCMLAFLDVVLRVNRNRRFLRAHALRRVLVAWVGAQPAVR